MAFERSAGVLLHPTSLPGPYGVGEIGAEARRFADALAEAGQTWWQTLPMTATGGGASPYSSTSSFAGNPLVIALDELVALNLLDPSDLEPLRALNANRVDFAAMIPARSAVLAKAGAALAARSGDALAAERDDFIAREDALWLDDYALWEALSQAHARASWLDWPAPLRDRDPGALAAARIEHGPAIAAVKALQFLFDRQWMALKAYCAARGVRFIGDMAIFVAHDSADVWAGRDQFLLDEAGASTVVAGVPPDYFSETGQLWGNPLYDWPRMEADGFSWWIARARRILELNDAVRIDHFRGFAAYWAVKAGAETAVDGEWVPAPGHALFSAMMKALPDALIIAEDLGHITEDVNTLRDAFSFPGLKILQFEFGDGAPHGERHPYHYPAASACYPGSHDNNTILGWFRNEGADAEARKDDFEREGAAALELMGGDGSDIAWRFVELALHSGSVLAVSQLQDVMGLDGAHRMNVPGTIEGNWSWRFSWDMLAAEDLAKLRALTAKYGRLR